MADLVAQSLSYLFLMLTGGVILQIIVHRYQKTKDARKTKESLVKQISTLSRYFFNALLYWEHWIENSLIISEIEDEEESDKAVEEKEDELEDESIGDFYEKDFSLRNEAEKTFIDFLVEFNELIGRFVVHCEARPQYSNVFQNWQANIEKIASVMQETFIEGKPTKKVEKLAEKVEIIRKMFIALYLVILTAKMR